MKELAIIGLSFLSMRKGCYGNLDSMQMYLGKIHKARDKKYMCTWWERRWKFWRRQWLDVRCLRCTKRDSTAIFSVCMGFECYKSLQCFAVISVLGFILPPSRQERIQWLRYFSCLMPESAAFAGMSCYQLLWECCCM